LTPNMAIIDPNFVDCMPKGLTAASGIDALVHSVEAYVSALATNFTNSNELEATKLVFRYLERSYNEGANDPLAREKMHYAATIAGMAFANSFLGLCHSMAHKLGAFHHLPHGVANAIMINIVLRFNSAEVPTKMGTFPQYDHPKTLEKYAYVSRCLGFGGETDEQSLENLINAIEELKKYNYTNIYNNSGTSHPITFSISCIHKLSSIKLSSIL